MASSRAPPAGRVGGRPGPWGARAFRARREADRRFWEARFRGDPAFFGRGASPFARWCLPWLRRQPVRTLLEIGSGEGRDLAFFLRRHLQAHGVEATRSGVRAGRRALALLVGAAGAARLLQQGDAIAHLRRPRRSRVEAVYSNLVFNMAYTCREHRELFRLVRDHLVPGGLHLFSVRSVHDPWYGRGRRVGPDTFDLAPDGTAMHFFSAGYARELLAGTGFRPLALVERSEGGSGFPTRVLYVCAVRADGRHRGRPAASPGATGSGLPHRAARGRARRAVA